MRLSFMMDKKAFTLIEIIVVIVILGVLGVLVMPRLMDQQENAKFSEGVSAGQVLFGAQQRYYLDHDAYTADCADLDVDLTPKNFTVSCSTTDPIVSVVRSDGSYTIEVSVVPAGALFSCTGCNAALMRQLPQ